MKKETSENTLTKNEQTVEAYILGTLLYTPQFYAKSQSCVEIKVYAPDKDQPSMKIFRQIIRCVKFEKTPVGLKEIAFQDEVSFVKGEGIDYNQRFQVNFSIYVDEEKFTFHSIEDKPHRVNNAAKCLEVFKILSTQKGARLYAGDWFFESDAVGWIQKDRNGNILLDQPALIQKQS